MSELTPADWFKLPTVTEAELLELAADLHASRTLIPGRISDWSPPTAEQLAAAPLSGDWAVV